MTSICRWPNKMVIWCHMIELSSDRPNALWSHSGPVLYLGILFSQLRFCQWEAPVTDEHRLPQTPFQLGGPIPAMTRALLYTLFPKPCPCLEKCPSTRLSSHFQVRKCHLLPTGTMIDMSGIRWKSHLCYLSKPQFWLLQLCTQNALPWPDSRGL